MTKSTIKSTLGFAVLGLISRTPMTGYDLRKVFATTPMGHFSSSPGAIYPALKRLEEDGLIEGVVEGKNTLRPKRVYTLTEKGAEVLRQQISQPVAQDDIIWRMDELMLRFVFMDHILGQEKAVNFLKEFILRIEAYIPSLQEQFEEIRDSGVLYGAFALEHGIEMYKTNIRWARHVIKQLQSEVCK
ncbi:PadR family transcriptional regulator [Candidatus Poribacteria bacterium]